LILSMLNIHSNVVLSSWPFSPEVCSYFKTSQLKFCPHFLSREIRRNTDREEKRN
jgi:hypothetical protein